MYLHNLSKVKIKYSGKFMPQMKNVHNDCAKHDTPGAYS